MFIKIDNRKLHYKRIGKGKRSIIFVHGWGGSLYSLHQLATLASDNFSCYLVDLPGFGKSDPPPPQWGIEGYSEAVLCFINQLGIKNPSYVGHSFGGEIGLYLATKNKNLFDSLILCNSAFKRSNKKSLVTTIIRKFFPNGLGHHGLTRRLRELYYRLFHHQSDLTKYPHLEHNFRKIVREDLTQTLTSITTKTLILWGENDSITPVIWAYELKNLIANSTVVVFPNCTHNLPIKHPREVWVEISRFLG